MSNSRFFYHYPVSTSLQSSNDKSRINTVTILIQYENNHYLIQWDSYANIASTPSDFHSVRAVCARLGY